MDDPKGLRLVLLMAREMLMGCQQGSIELGDLIGFGMVGLERAREKYDPERSGWTVYAWWWVRKEIQKGIASWGGHHACSHVWRSRARDAEYCDGLDASDEGEDERARLKREMWKGLFSLPKDEGLPLFLKFYHGFPVKDIAEVTGGSPRRTQKLIDAGIKKLRAMLVPSAEIVDA